MIRAQHPPLYMTYTGNFAAYERRNAFSCCSSSVVKVALSCWASTVALNLAAVATSNSCILLWDLFLFSLEITMLSSRGVYVTCRSVMLY